MEMMSHTPVLTMRLINTETLTLSEFLETDIPKYAISELTEAINSTFRFYLHADVCYAWLMDLPPDNRDVHYRLPKCRWFTRGWTLQELIAPRVLKFYDQAWTFRGTKSNLG
ncbi:hypothetical protein V8C34DRAFT_285920 [Trichoderma compactum]